MDAIDGIVALAWENIDLYESYPEYRFVLSFGDDKDTVLEKIRKSDINIA